MNRNFKSDIYEYNVYIDDNLTSVQLLADFSGNEPDKATIKAEYANKNTGNTKTTSITPGSDSVTGLSQFIDNKNADDKTILKKAGVEGDMQTYTFNVKRTPTTDKLNITDASGSTVKINEDFSPNVTEYTATVVSDKITIETKPHHSEAGYVITYNGSEKGVVSLADGENSIAIKIKNSKG